MRDEYDLDDDGSVDTDEALSVCWDLWRLLLAARDASAWNVPDYRPDYEVSQVGLRDLIWCCELEYSSRCACWPSCLQHCSDS